MKIKITFKSPDGYSFAISEAVADELNANQGQLEAVPEFRDELNRRLKKWVKYEELITVEFDIDAMTATVLPAQ